MKKALAIISAVALVGVAAFAEDASLKLSGYIDTGVLVKTTDAEGLSDSVTLYGDDSGKTTRFDINGSYVNGNSGVDFKLREQVEDTGDGSKTFAAVPPSINYFHVWSSLFDGKAKVVAGRLDNSAWKTSWGDDGFQVENDEGVQIQVLPVQGLNLGVKFNTNGTGTYTPKDFLNELGLGAKYSSDTFEVAGGYKLDSKGDDTATADVESDDNAFAYAGFNWKGTAKLKLNAEAKWMVLGAYSDAGKAEYDETIAYQVTDPLEVGLLCYQYTTNADTVTATLGAVSGTVDSAAQMNFKPYANYKFNDVVTLNGAVFYELNSQMADKCNSMYLKPGATFQLSPAAKIITWYKYEIQDLSDEYSKTVNNYLCVNFRYNF